ncbi:hypothetical protein [Aeromonas caviae]|uniref:hypothetical protein n=1 Tax=Aeromonas caviae TaxID=648 RepID=UPI001CC368B7|nr:hypothetical protein [Aeromonas caviae]GJB59026.1 hypothetical protein KAM374_15620 [Aeromonas caviae]GKQ70559.1 hypothetical protein KAM371_15640 [Aeromonas caviae]GKQ84335.1 hypothetical protein KAM449_20820 [Aeromonas caviae]GKQ93182.1 hypothetical protein KAM451_19480 [Aeromonas caviae]GKR99029.1 hypothetical protein KAM486_12650 [Aeromonas caviae]
MYWPDTQTGVDVEPARKPVASAVRKFFTEGGLGQAPTVPGGDWFNQITNELLNVLDAAGIDPSKTDDDQLLQAINGISKALSAREALRRTYAESGFNLVPGSFELGGTVTTATDVLLYEATGKGYSHNGSLPFTALPESTPDSNWIDRSAALLSVMMPITHPALAGGAVSGQDSTAAIAAAGALGGTFYVPKGEYIISSAAISKNCTFIFERGASFKRANGLDIKQSYWAAGVPMLDAVADGLTITFVDPLFDGNKANQPAVQVGYSGANATTEPSGWTFRYTPVNAATAKDCKFVFVRPTFKNGTSGYLLVRGDDVNRRFRTQIILNEPEFTDTIYGYGKGDPATPTALGWSSDYIQALDYVDIFLSNPDMSYLAGPTPTGRYAPVGIRGTFFGSDVATAGGVSIYSVGVAKLRGLGRKTLRYDGGDNVTNNGIGAIDGYGDCKNFYFDVVDAADCENVPVRAKSTIDNYYVNKAILKNCKRGLQVAPAASGLSNACVYIGSVDADGGWNPQLEIIGNSTSDRLRSLTVGSARIKNGTNGEGLASNIGGAVFRNITDVDHGRINISNQDNRGVWYIGCPRINGKITSSGTGHIGVQVDDCQEMVDLDATIQNTGLNPGLSASGTCKSFNVKASVDGADGYGVFANISAGHVNIHDSNVANLTGLSRGFYIGAAGGTICGSSIGAGVSAGLVAADFSQISQYDNSWNPRNALYRASASAPTTGDFRRGDIIYMPPSPSGFIGWTCTTAGVAGSTAVFKRFGTIEA